LVRGEIVQGLVGPEGVVAALSVLHLPVQGSQDHVSVVELISACGGLRVNALGTLHMAVKPFSKLGKFRTCFRGSGWKDKEAESSALADLLKGHWGKGFSSRTNADVPVRGIVKAAG
jgi:hypothetical protein